MPTATSPTLGFYPAVVRLIAHGEGANPDTLILIERPAILIKSGVGLRLYTRELRTYTHLAWAVVERIRVIEKDEVEFVLRYMGWDEERSRGDRHLLLASSDQTDVVWKWRRTLPMAAEWWRRLGGDITPIPRYIPPTPLSSASTSRSVSTSSLTWPSSSDGPTGLADPAVEASEARGGGDRSQTIEGGEASSPLSGFE